jgi:hypothetical protein
MDVVFVFFFFFFFSFFSSPSAPYDWRPSNNSSPSFER